MTALPLQNTLRKEWKQGPIPAQSETRRLGNMERMSRVLSKEENPHTDLFLTRYGFCPSRSPPPVPEYPLVKKHQKGVQVFYDLDLEKQTQLALNLHEQPVELFVRLAKKYDDEVLAEGKDKQKESPSQRRLNKLLPVDMAVSTVAPPVGRLERVARGGVVPGRANRVDGEPSAGAENEIAGWRKEVTKVEINSKKIKPRRVAPLPQVPSSNYSNQNASLHKIPSLNQRKSSQAGVPEQNSNNFSELADLTRGRSSFWVRTRSRGEMKVSRASSQQNSKNPSISGERKPSGGAEDLSSGTSKNKDRHGTNSVPKSLTNFSSSKNQGEYRSKPTAKLQDRPAVSVTAHPLFKQIQSLLNVDSSEARFYQVRDKMIIEAERELNRLGSVARVREIIQTDTSKRLNISPIPLQVDMETDSVNQVMQHLQGDTREVEELLEKALNRKPEEEGEQDFDEKYLKDQEILAQRGQRVAEALAGVDEYADLSVSEEKGEANNQEEVLSPT